MKIRNKIRPNTELWGTLLVTVLLEEYSPLTHTCCHLSLTHALIQV